MLDVTMTRDGRTRRWTICEQVDRWTYYYVDYHELEVGGCETLDLAQAKKAEWETEIAAARADGWQVTPGIAIG